MSPEISHSIFVSVIMPIRNESDFIARSLGSVLLQDYPPHLMEILIADGMSEDATRSIIATMSEATIIPIKIVDNPQHIVPTGFNRALRQSQGDVIVRVDGHCEIAPDYVRQCVEHLIRYDVAGVGGPIETISSTHIGRAISLAMSSSFGVGGSSFRIIQDKTLFVDTIAFPAYWKHIMQEVGELDEEMVRNQDDEYNYRLRSHGYKLLLSPKIRSKYYSRSSIYKLWRQYYQYGYYKVRVMQKHPSQMRPRQFVPLLMVSSVIGGIILAPFNKIFRWLWLIVLVLYTSANSIASYVTARRDNPEYMRVLPIIFATLHFSYGLGFLRGLLDFRNRWDEQYIPPLNSTQAQVKHRNSSILE